MSMKNQNRNLSRRKILIGSLQAAGLLLISGCEKLFNGLQENKIFVSLLELAEEANRSAQRLFTQRNKLAQEFTERDLSRDFQTNGFPPPMTMDYIADTANRWSSWRLEVLGGVRQVTKLSLAELKSPQTILPYEMNDEFVADIKYSARQRRLLGRSRLRVVRGDLMTCAIMRRLSTKNF
jgi:hypothetical protein